VKCNVCMNEWSGTSDEVRCPFCGADLSRGADQHDVSGVISFLIKKEGIDVLLRPDTVTAYISDLVRDHERDKKLMRVGVANGILQRAHSVLTEPKQSRREVMVLDMKRHLMDSAFLSEQNAEAIVILTLNGIGLPALAAGMKSAGSDNPTARSALPTMADKPTAEPSRKSDKPPAASSRKDEKKSQPPPKPQKQQSHNGRFTVNSIRTFAYDGSSFAARKVRGPLFLKAETTMIGILLSFDPVQTDMNAMVDWQIFRQDGTPVSQPIHGTALLRQGNMDYYQGWGWNQPDKWDVGRYFIRAFMNGSAPVIAYFEVVDGKFDDPVIPMFGARLFTGGSTPPPQNARAYSDTFHTGTTCRIYFEISVRTVLKPLYTTVNYRIIGPDGEVWANYAEPVRFNVGADRCWTGYGWDTPGHWMKGRYSYELSIGKSGGVLQGTFDVV